MSTLRDQCVSVARSQLGVRYWSLHYGPKGSSQEGFGCAQYCRFVFRQVLGVNYVGSCYEFAGDALGQSVNQGGGEFEFISASEAQPGDCVIYGARNHDGKDYYDYGHIALYVGNGRVIGAMGKGVPGQAGYLNIGIKETSVAAQNIGGVTRYIRCKRLKGSKANTNKTTKGDFAVSKKVTFKTKTNVRDNPSITKGKVVTHYEADQSVTIDAVTIADGIVWGHYVGSTSGKDRYVSLTGTIR